MSSRMRDVLSATRIHYPAEKKKIPEKSATDLKAYLQSLFDLGIPGAIAVNQEWLVSDVKEIHAEFLVEQKKKKPSADLSLTVLHVAAWGAFVPALNTLLLEASKQEFRYILYQSLETICTKTVLRYLMNHHTADTLVVGATLDGHEFVTGAQPLNGRSCPWNTLGLWNTRKLGLTGFLSIADGLPKAENRCLRAISMDGADILRQASDGSGAAGVPGKTMGDASYFQSIRAESSDNFHGGVSAGVEEVSAVALLQHLLGEDRARAILLDIPKEHVTWKADFSNDKARQEWHEKKMASKKSRPAEQMKILFWGKSSGKSLLMPLLTGRESPQAEEDLHFGTVLHFGDSIRSAPEVEMTCLYALALFSANFTSMFGSVFLLVNAMSDADWTTPNALFVSALVGGVYIMIPVSLPLTRRFVLALDHRGGLLLFGGLMCLSHVLVVFWQLQDNTDHGNRWVLLASRLMQGLGSGVLFQTRYVLASTSTQENHMILIVRQFLAMDLGLAFGALIPFLASAFSGFQELSRKHPELGSSSVMALLSFFFVCQVLIRFPARLHVLPNKVRFPFAEYGDASSGYGGTMQTPRRDRIILLSTGTARVFVQSAAVFAVALWMRDAGLTGSFHQTQAVALLCVLPAPMEWLAAKCGAADAKAVGHGLSKQNTRLGRTVTKTGAVSLTSVAVVVLIMLLSTYWVEHSGTNADSVKHPLSMPNILVPVELVGLLLALGIAVPVNVSHLNCMPDSEGDMAKLEWLKAYVGRILGPTLAFMVHNSWGNAPLLGLLCLLTAFVACSA